MFRQSSRFHLISQSVDIALPHPLREALESAVIRGRPAPYAPTQTSLREIPRTSTLPPAWAAEFRYSQTLISPLTSAADSGISPTPTWGFGIRGSMEFKSAWAITGSV